MYIVQVGSVISPFETLTLMMEYVRALPWVQRTCCTLFDYVSKKYAEGKDFEPGKPLNWQKMP